MVKGTSRRVLKLASLPIPEADGTSTSSGSKQSAVVSSPNSSITTSISTPTKGAWREKTASPKSGKVRFLQQIRKHHSFLKVRLEVSPHPEGATGVSEALGKLLTIFQAADNTVQLAIYKSDSPNPENDAINKAASIPTQITAFQKYAFRAKPNKKGGTTWTNIKILHDADIQDILAGTKDECYDINFGVYLQNIQHHDVQVVGWLMHMHDGVDLVFWKNFFDEELEKRKYPRGSVGLMLRKPLDGRFSKEKKS